MEQDVIAPKYGMDMEEFMANLPKDKRVPALRDRNSIDAFRASKGAADPNTVLLKEYFDKGTMHLAL